MISVGILTPSKAGNRFPDYYKQFIAAGRELGASVFLITPPAGGRIAEDEWRGYVSSGDGWKAVSVPRPDIVINRFGRFLRSREELEDYFTFRDTSGLLFANHTVDNKLHLFHQLRSDPEIGRQLPETVECSADALGRMLSRYDLLYMKPKNGTGGRGIYRIERAEKSGKYRLQGHDAHRRNRISETLDRNALIDRLAHIGEQGVFLVQQGLDLRLLPGRNADLRLLLQKENGNWTATGTAVRIGKRGSPVSNLHGGGTGHRSEPFLAERFGRKRSALILKECSQLAKRVARAIEANYGRMLELGFDLGIDTQGKVWLIEVNTMPQRNLLLVTGQAKTYQLAFRRPIAEAIRLAKEEGGAM